MKRRPSLSSLVASVLLPILLSSCTTSQPETRTIDAVTPYSTLSDDELKQQYLVRLVALQQLNQEMTAANAGRDFATVNARAREGLEQAYDARQLARHLDDPAERDERLEGIAKIIKDLEHLVEITS